jgi:hypothetical protein
LRASAAPGSLGHVAEPRDGNLHFGAYLPLHQSGLFREIPELVSYRFQLLPAACLQADTLYVNAIGRAAMCNASVGEQHERQASTLELA